MHIIVLFVNMSTLVIYSAGKITEREGGRKGGGREEGQRERRGRGNGEAKVWRDGSEVERRNGEVEGCKGTRKGR